MENTHAPLTDLTAQPTSSPLSLYLYRDGLYAVDLLAAALQLGFFTWLISVDGAGDVEIKAQFGFADRPLDVMLTLFRSQGYITTVGGHHAATVVAREHLQEGSPWFLGPYFSSLHSRPVAKDFLEVLCSGKPAGWSGDQSAGDWHKAMEEPAFARSFTNAMDCRGRLLATALAKACPLPAGSRLLDIGGGSGIYACGFAAHNAELRATVLDQAPVDRICRTCIEERGFASQVDVVAGNMFEGIPTGFNVHLFSNVLHDWDFAEARELLRLSHESLAPGGLLIIHDAFVNADKSGPVHVAEYSALLMHSTQGKCYSTTEYHDLMVEAGFEPGAYHDTLVGRGFMVGRRIG